MINMNKPETFTREAVADLLGSKDDSAHRQVRVMNNGDVILSDDVGFVNIANVRFRMETLSSGTGYVGAAAAKDDKWVGRIYDSLQEHWAAGTTGYIDFY